MTGPPGSSATRSEMEAAFRRHLSLPNDEATEIKLGRALNQLAPISAIVGQTVSDAPFRQTSRKTARTELNQLANLAQQLTKHVENLHAPAIDALADLGVMRSTIIAFASKLETAARQADVSHVPINPGRGTEQKVRQASLVASLIYVHFEALTGDQPTILRKNSKAAGPYVSLLSDLLRIMNIKASPEARARETIRRKRP